MNFNLLSLFLAIIAVDCISICSKYTTTVGKAASVFIDPVCSASCRLRNCGGGRCRTVYKHYGDREDRYECVCDKCRNQRNVYGDWQ